MLQSHDGRQSGEIVGFYMMRGGAPCAVDCYLDYFQQFIGQHELEDLFIFDPQPANNHYGLHVSQACRRPWRRLSRWQTSLWKWSRVCVWWASRGVGTRMRTYWNQYVDSASSLKALKANLETLIDRISAIPHADPAIVPRSLSPGTSSLAFTRRSWKGSTNSTPGTGSS